MNLHAVVAPVVAAVNPLMPVAVRISTGKGAPGPDGVAAPAYATPGSFTGSIAGNVLTVTAAAAGVLQIGQTVAGAGVAPKTLITDLLTGSGGVGTYRVGREQTVASGALTTTLDLFGDVQPTTWRDIQMLDGLNIEGVRWKIYLSGQVDGLVRPERKGGDLVVIPSGPHAGTWLVAQVLEQFADWVAAAITLQNE